VVAGFVAYAEPINVLCASVTTLVMVSALTLVAFYSNTAKIEKKLSLFTSFLMCVWPALLFCLLNPVNWLFILVQLILITLFSLYLVYDTRRLAEIFQEDEYVPASIMLYVDTCMIFIFVLYIFGKNK